MITLRAAIGFNPVLQVKEAVKIAVKAEEYGYESIWIHESLFQRDIVSYLSLILNSTKKLKAASGVINTYTRHPVVTATTFGTLGEFSNGRVIMGLGLGSFPTIPKIGQHIFPVKETRPVNRISEYVELVRSLWSGINVNFRGKFFQAENLQMGFRVSNQIPVYIAGLSSDILELAGKVGDGAILSPALATVEATRKMSSYVQSGEAIANRKVDKASYILASVDPDENKARENMRSFYFFLFQLAQVIKSEDLEPYSITEEQLAPMKQAWKKGDIAGAKNSVPDRAIDALSLTGTKEKVLSRLAEYLSADLDLPIIMPIGNVDYAVSTFSPEKSK